MRSNQNGLVETNFLKLSGSETKRRAIVESNLRFLRHHPSPLHPWFFSCAFKAARIFCPAGHPSIWSVFNFLRFPKLSGSEVKFSHELRSSSVSDSKPPIISGSETKLSQKLRSSLVSDLHSPNLSGSDTKLLQLERLRVVKDLHSPNSGSDTRDSQWVSQSFSSLVKFAILSGSETSFIQ